MVLTKHTHTCKDYIHIRPLQESLQLIYIPQRISLSCAPFKHKLATQGKSLLITLSENYLPYSKFSVVQINFHMHPWNLVTMHYHNNTWLLPMDTMPEWWFSVPMSLRPPFNIQTVSSLIVLLKSPMHGVLRLENKTDFQSRCK